MRKDPNRRISGTQAKAGFWRRRIVLGKRRKRPNAWLYISRQIAPQRWQAEAVLEQVLPVIHVISWGIRRHSYKETESDFFFGLRHCHLIPGRELQDREEFLNNLRALSERTFPITIDREKTEVRVLALHSNHFRVEPPATEIIEGGGIAIPIG